MLDDLKRVADLVRKRDPVWGGDAEHAQYELADGRGGQLAVVEQLVERVVARDDLVAPVGLDQPQERLAWKTALTRGDGECAHHRVLGMVEFALDLVEQLEPVSRGLVSDVVDEPREAVDSEQVAAKTGTE